MDKGEIKSQIEILEKARALLGFHRPKPNDPEDIGFGKFAPYEQEILGTASSIYKRSYSRWTKEETDSRVVDVRTFHQFVAGEEIQKLIDHLYEELNQEEPKKAPEPKQQDNTVPAELESMVAEYEKFKDEQKENDGSATSVADAVKRAREAMIVRERLKSIRENRAALSGNADKFNTAEDKRYEDLITKLCDPKAKNSKTILEPVEVSLTEAVHSYIEQRTDITQSTRDELSKLAPSIVKNAQDLYLNGALNISNHFDLVVGIEISIHLTSTTTTTPTSRIYDDLVKQEQEVAQMRSDISKEEIKLSLLQTQLSKATSKAELESILSEIEKVQSGINNLNGKIESIPTKLNQSIIDKSSEIESHIQSQTEGTINNNNVTKYIRDDNGNLVPARNFDGSLVVDRDFTDNLVDGAGKTISGIHEKLIAGGIKGKLPPTEHILNGASDIELAIRKQLPDIGLDVNPTYEASRLAVLLSDQKAQNPELSAEAVLLYGKGLTKEKLDQVIDEATRHPNDTDIGRLLKANPDLFGKLRHQLSSIEETVSVKAEEYAKSNPDSTLGQLFSQNKEAYNAYVKLSEKLSPKQIAQFAKNNPDSILGKVYQANSKIFGKIGKEFKNVKDSALATQIGKPIKGIKKVVTGIQNRIISFGDKIAPIFNFVFDPVGSIRNYLGRKAGEYLLKQVAKVLSEKAGKQLVELGAKAFAKEMLKKAAERVVIEATKLAAKTGIKLGTEAALAGTGVGIPVALVMIGLDILQWVGGLAKKAINQVSITLYGEEFNTKTAARDTAIAITAFGSAGLSAIVGITAAIAAAAAAAASSAFVTIIVSSFVGFFIYVSAIVVGPMISTLAQLESVPAADLGPINCTNMPWPFDGIYSVNQGPNTPACTHHGGIAQSADFGTPLGTPILSMTDGVVLKAINSSQGYGNHVIIQALTDNGESFEIYYAHFSSLSVSEGENVKAGQELGLSGNTGNSTGPHLHLEYRGIDYNSCPAGGFVIMDDCCIDTTPCNQP